MLATDATSSCSTAAACRSGDSTVEEPGCTLCEKRAGASAGRRISRPEVARAGIGAEGCRDGWTVHASWRTRTAARALHRPSLLSVCRLPTGGGLPIRATSFPPGSAHPNMSSARYSSSPSVSSSSGSASPHAKRRVRRCRPRRVCAAGGVGSGRLRCVSRGEGADDGGCGAAAVCTDWDELDDAGSTDSAAGAPIDCQGRSADDISAAGHPVDAAAACGPFSARGLDADLSGDELDAPTRSIGSSASDR
mmetsp:Transcript_24352/g.78549  ORF Transcript_24352/g.78549 Transcript_24352/m.78549 type:complete len:250 (+) Transcript_24352:129-878(+)|eukprot:scaffold6013_cov210-Isochrysis_galbana.AAC.8